MPPSTPASGNGSPGMIWLRPERAGRGPQPAHSRAAIAAAAIALADAEGIDAVSMRKVAASLGAGTMSLYNYVPKKEHLFDLMLDAAAGELALPDGPSGDPRADLSLLARELLAAGRRHPWLSGLTMTRPSMGPNALRCTEYFLAAVADVPADGATKMELFALLNGFVAQFAEWERTAAGGASTQWQTELIAYFTGAVATGQYPHLAATLAASGAAPPLDADALFARSLDRVLTMIVTAPGITTPVVTTPVVTTPDAGAADQTDQES